MAKKPPAPPPRQESEDTRDERDARVADMMDRAKHHLGEADRFVNSAEEKRQAEIARRGINR